MSYDGRTYRVTVGKCERELPIFEGPLRASRSQSLNMLGDTEVRGDSRAGCCRRVCRRGLT